MMISVRQTILDNSCYVTLGIDITNDLINVVSNNISVGIFVIVSNVRDGVLDDIS
jgi:hypothetical protein